MRWKIEDGADPTNRGRLNLELDADDVAAGEGRVFVLDQQLLLEIDASDDRLEVVRRHRLRRHGWGLTIAHGLLHVAGSGDVDIFAVGGPESLRPLARFPPPESGRRFTAYRVAASPTHAFVAGTGGRESPAQ